MVSNVSLSKMRLPLLKPLRVLVKKHIRIQLHWGKHPTQLAMELQYYPDGSEVKQGHMLYERGRPWSMCLKEINIISDELDKLNLGLACLQ